MTVSSESNYDKLTVTLDSSEVVSYVSGEQIFVIVSNRSGHCSFCSGRFFCAGAWNMQSADLVFIKKKNKNVL